MRGHGAALVGAVWLSLAGGGAVLAAAADAGKASTDSGPLTGSIAGGVASFKGVPYAKPPVGALRWAPPQRPERWTTARDATAFGASCPQTPMPQAALTALGGAMNATAEDCLTLNVWAPVGAKKAPVMVWIHGGGNRIGAASNAYYDGTSFARDGVVMVSMNYRLGPLGFFAHPGLTKASAEKAPLGDYGVMDQIAALEWVKRNAAAFGGDPANVTVFGESAGGSDILTLLSIPSTKGLYAKAVVESGGGWNPLPTLAEREAAGDKAAHDAGLPAGATAEQLRALPLDKLFTPAFTTANGPMIDGRLVTESPAAAFAGGRAQDVPMIIGSNSGEDSLMSVSGATTASVLAQVPPSALPLIRKADGSPDDATLAKDLFRDAIMGAPARWIAGRAAGGQPAWLYHFAYVPGSVRAAMPRAVHGSEILFVFQTLDRAPIKLPPADAADTAMQAMMHGCWTSFAKTGAPACPGGPAWPRYDAATDAPIVFDTTTTVQPDFRKAAYDFQNAAFTTRLRAAAAPAVDSAKP